MQSSQI